MMKINSKLVFLFLLLGIVVCYGFGNAIVYKLSLGVIFAFPVIDSLKQKRYADLMVSTIVIISVCYCNSLLFSSSLIFIFLLSFYDNIFAYAFIASRIIFAASQYIFLNNALISWPSALLFYLVFVLACKKSAICGKTLVIIYAVLLVFNSLSSLALPIVQESNIMPGYGIGFAIQKIVKKNQAGNGKLLINLKKATILEDDITYYLEHDAPTQFTDGNYYQKRPWGNNVILANETIQMAINRDGFLISNLGGKISNGKHKTLMSFVEGLTTIPFAIINHGNIVLSDSDFSADGLAPYQANLIRRITATDYQYICFHVFCALCLIATIFIKNKFSMVTIIVFYLFVFSIPTEGDVRFIGKRRYWPHTTLGEGVVKTMQDQGINAIFGAKNASVLVVAEGHRAKRYNEKVIILEPSAKVKVDNKIYTAGTLELGYSNGIVDARDIILNGESLGPVVNIEGIKIIATGSPARVNFKE